MKCYVYYKDASMKDFKPLNPNYEPTSVLVRAAVVDSDDPIIRKELIDGTIEDSKGKAFVAMQLRSCDNGKVIYSRSTEDEGPSEAKQKKCSMAKKIEALSNKNEAKFSVPADVVDAMKKVKDFLEKNESALYENPDVDGNIVPDDDWSSGFKIELARDVLSDIIHYAETGSVVTESKKKNEDADVGGTIKMNIDYNTFMELCANAAYLTDDKDYHDALWEYYKEFGEIDGEASVFFDNLFQYTDWADVERIYDEMLSDKYKDDNKSKEECVQAAIDDGDLDAVEYGDGMFLILQ